MPELYKVMGEEHLNRAKHAQHYYRVIRVLTVAFGVSLVAMIVSYLLTKQAQVNLHFIAGVLSLLFGGVLYIYIKLASKAAEARLSIDIGEEKARFTEEDWADFLSCLEYIQVEIEIATCLGSQHKNLYINGKKVDPEKLDIVVWDENVSGLGIFPFDNDLVTKGFSGLTPGVLLVDKLTGEYLEKSNFQIRGDFTENKNIGFGKMQ